VDGSQIRRATWRLGSRRGLFWSVDGSPSLAVRPDRALTHAVSKPLTDARGRRIGTD